jgi:hypothetical protein
MLAVEMVRRTDDHSLYPTWFQQLPVIPGGEPYIELLLHALEIPLVNVTNASHVDVCESLQHRDMIFCGPPACSDESDLDFLRHAFAPLSELSATT